MAGVARVLMRIKHDLKPFLSESQILNACRTVGHRWRERRLGPVQTLHLFILQVLNFNTAMSHLRHLASGIKAPAYCRARMRLPLAVFTAVLRDSTHAMSRSAGAAGARWCGLRAFLVDGSSTIAPDTPASQNAFGQPPAAKAGCGFAVPKILGMFDAWSGLIIELLTFPLFTHDQSQVWLLHHLLGKGDVLVGDRGFCSFWHAAMLASREVMCVFRMHSKQIVNFRPHRRAGRKGGPVGRPSSTFVRRLGKWDQIVRWVKPDQRPAWMTLQQYADAPRSLLVREVRYVVASRGQRTRCVTIATTLLDPTDYPKQKIVDLYQVRWSIETHFAELKTVLKMRRIKSRTPDGIRKELAAYCLVYNLVRIVMMKTARHQHTTPSRVSFIDAVRWLLSAQPADCVPLLKINPHRPDRHEPREVKERHGSYKVMTQPRKSLQIALLARTRTP